MKNFLNKEVPATGGILLIFISVFLAFIMISTVTLARTTTSRSVAKNVTQTIALECLASCYVNNVSVDSSTHQKSWLNNPNVTFESLSKDGDPIEPLNQFNNIMINYNLMRPTGESKEVHCMYQYYKTSKKDTTFTLQFGQYQCFGAHWSNIYVQPDRAKAVIEES